MVHHIEGIDPGVEGADAHVTAEREKTKIKGEDEEDHESEPV